MCGRQAGSMLDAFEPVVRRLLEECPDIKAPRVTETLRDDYGYVGSVDLVRRRMAALRPASGERAAQRTGYRPGQVMQVDWAEMPTRPRIDGRERRVYALICSLPYSGASTAHFSFDKGPGDLRGCGLSWRRQGGGKLPVSRYGRP